VTLPFLCLPPTTFPLNFLQFLRVHLPPSYPSEHPPVLELSDSCDCLPGDVLLGLAAELEAMFSPGEVVLWNWVEHLRERWPDIAPQQQQPQADGHAAACA
jgi:hypothetical protein